MRREKERLETRECTFSPQILKKRQRSGKVFEKLYKTHREKQQENRDRMAETQKEKMEKELENCTFKPEFQSTFKEKGKFKLNCRLSQDHSSEGVFIFSEQNSKGLYPEKTERSP